MEICDYEHSNFLGLRHQIEDILKYPGKNKLNMISIVYLNFSLQAFTRVAIYLQAVPFAEDKLTSVIK